MSRAILGDHIHPTFDNGIPRASLISQARTYDPRLHLCGTAVEGISALAIFRVFLCRMELCTAVDEGSQAARAYPAKNTKPSELRFLILLSDGTREVGFERAATG